MITALGRCCRWQRNPKFYATKQRRCKKGNYTFQHSVLRFVCSTNSKHNTSTVAEVAVGPCGISRRQHSDSVIVRCNHSTITRYYGNTSNDSLVPPSAYLVDTTVAPRNFDDQSAVVYPDIISEEEAGHLTAELEGNFRRRRYEKNHWDAVINFYKEVELSEELLSEPVCDILERVRHHLSVHHLNKTENIMWLPCHAIDLHATGDLNAHVDSVRFSGDIVAGISLLSGSIMRLYEETRDDVSEGKETENACAVDIGSTTDASGHRPYVDLYLPPQSLYVLSGTARYRYTHELLPAGSSFRGELPVCRSRRMSIIFRDAKME